VFESAGLNQLDFALWGWIKGEVRKRKVDTLDALLARILDAAARTRKRDDQLEQHAIFAHELQNALRFMVEFTSIYCEM
jgi:hypothetical protein